MTSLVELAGDHLAGIGLTPGLLGTLIKGMQGDILQVALRITLIGIVTASLRTAFYSFRSKIKEAVLPCAHISSKDPAFEWMMAFLAQDQGVQAQLCSFRLVTADSRDSRRDDTSRHNPYRKEKGMLSLARTEATFSNDEIVGQIGPINEHEVCVNHNGAKLWVRRSDRGYAHTQSTSDNDHIVITGLFYQRDSIRDLIVAAHEVFYQKADNELLVFHVNQQYGTWSSPISRPVRSWNSVVLPGTVKTDLLDDVRNFLSDEEKAWYTARGIPHRRGYLLHGRPGAGKTTLATAIASELKLDIYVVDPGARGMDDGKMNRAFRSCPPGSMILMEDIDCVMPSRKRSADDEGDEEVERPEEVPDVDPGKFGLAKSTVTLSGLLNAIDGVSSQEGCVLFASTNHPERLDEALSRPGRFDVHAEFFDATHEQARVLFKHFYPPAEVDSPDLEKSTANIEDLAQKFADDIFSTDKLADDTDVLIAVAALQGFLLKHKKKPVNAADGAKGWSHSLWKAQNDKAEKKLERVRAREEKERASNTSSASATVQGKVNFHLPPTPVSPAAPLPPLSNA